MTTLKLQIIPHHSLANNHRKAINHALRLLPEEQREHPQSVRDQYATIDALKAYPVPYTPMEIFELITQSGADGIAEKINTVAAEQNRRELFDSIRINVQNAGERRLERAIIDAQNEYATMLKQPREAAENAIKKAAPHLPAIDYQAAVLQGTGEHLKAALAAFETLHTLAKMWRVNKPEGFGSIAGGNLAYYAHPTATVPIPQREAFTRRRVDSPEAQEITTAVQEACEAFYTDPPAAILAIARGEHKHWEIKSPATVEELTHALEQIQRAHQTENH